MSEANRIACERNANDAVPVGRRILLVEKALLGMASCPSVLDRRDACPTNLWLDKVCPTDMVIGHNHLASGDDSQSSSSFSPFLSIPNRFM